MAELLGDAARALFRHYDVELGVPTYPETATLEAAAYMAVLGFSSEMGINGALAFAAEPGVLRQSYPLPDQNWSDWTGELSNQLLGRLKNLLLRHGIQVKLSVPVVVGGTDLTLAEVRTHFKRMCMCESAYGRVFMSLDLAIGPDVRLQPELEQEGAASEGDALFF